MDAPSCLQLVGCMYMMKTFNHTYWLYAQHSCTIYIVIYLKSHGYRCGALILQFVQAWIRDDLCTFTPADEAITNYQ